MLDNSQPHVSPTHLPLSAKLVHHYNHLIYTKSNQHAPKPPGPFETRWLKLYAYGDAKPPARQQLWHEITGFLEAGKVLSNVTTEELQAIIDEEHITAFGITREERQLKQKLAKTDDEQDWDKYDVPPKMR